MAIIDLSSPVGLLRLRLGDTRDIPILPDEVYEQALSEKNGNLKAATILCGNYILVNLAFNTHQKLMQVEVWGAEAYKNYKDYLMMVVKDPSFSGISPIPYSSSGEVSPIVEFQKDWYEAYKYPRCIGDL